MMKQKKWFICMVGILVLAGMTGCSKSDGEEIVPTPEPTVNAEENVALNETQEDEAQENEGQEDEARQEDEAGQMNNTESGAEETTEGFQGGTQDEAEPADGTGEVDWFAAYNGEKLHRIAAEAPQTYSPAVCADIVFYEAEAGEAMEDIIHTMIDAMIQPLTETSEDRPFTITAYRLEEQAYEIYDENISDVWLLPYLNGYYSYTGVDFVSMDTVMQEQPDLVQDGMVSFQRQGSEEAFVFVLMKEGNVYRLQRAQDMEAIYMEK